MPTLTIHRWNDTFENADTRKRQRLKFFHAPSGCDSHGYTELVTCHGSAGLLALGVFQALCQLAATMPSKVRGKFARMNGDAMPLRQIALLLRIELCHLEEAVEILTGEGIAWLRWEGDPEQSASNLPPSCQPEGEPVPETCQEPTGFVQGQGKGKGEGKDSNLSHGDDLPIERRHEIPKLDAVKAYARSAVIPISEACAVAFFDTQEASGWITRHGHAIADWRAALRRYASLWNQNEQRAAQRGGRPTGSPGHSNSYNETSALD